MVARSLRAMKFNVSVIFSVLLYGLVTSCGSKPEVESSVQQLEKAFPNGSANPDLQLAIAAARNSDYVAGVVALSNAKKLPGLSAEQLMAVERANQSITAELTRRADRGDVKARADLLRIEQTRSQ